MRWIECSDRMPALGQTVILKINGVVQKETFYLDAVDAEYSPTNFYWFRDDLEESPFVKSDHEWMPLPDPATGYEIDEQTRLIAAADTYDEWARSGDHGSFFDWFLLRINRAKLREGDQ